MTRDQIAAEFAAARRTTSGPNFSATPDDDKAVDALLNAHSKGFGFDPLSLIALIQMLLPLLQNNLPVLIELLKKIFSGTVGAQPA